MGAFEVFLGNIFIPSMVLLLGLQAFGIGRRQLNSLMMNIGSVHVTVNGWKVKLMPLLAIMNVIYLYSMLKKIQSLTENEHKKHNNHSEIET